MMEDQRLSRIEQKLDKLSEAVVSLARMEERIITLFNRMDTYDSRQLNMEDRVADIERISVGRGAVFKLVDKLIWIVVGLVTAVVIEGFLKR
jgi:hypothetical protein